MDAAPETRLARLVAWQRSGVIHALWPDIAPQRLLSAHHRIAAATRLLLNRADACYEWPCADELDRRAISAAAYLSGMGPLLGWWSEIGRLRLDGLLAATLAEHLAHGRRRAASLDVQFQLLLRRFASQGIVPVVLKGSFTGKRYFPDPGTRPSADIDLLVRPDQVSTAKEILRRDGFQRDVTKRSLDRSTWWRPEADNEAASLELDSAENPWSIDLHTSIDMRYFRGVFARFADAPWSMLREWDAGGVRAQSLAQPLLTAHLAIHASRPVHILRLVRIVELILVIRGDLAGGGLDWREFARLLDRTRLWRFAFPALEMAERLAPGLLDPPFRQQLVSRATRLSRRVVERLAANGIQGWSERHLDEHLMWFRGPIELALNVSELLWPRGMRFGAVVGLQSKRVRMLLRRP
jgi:hypothetical protein